jgi:hypothetical protein
MEDNANHNDIYNIIQQMVAANNVDDMVNNNGGPNEEFKNKINEYLWNCYYTRGRHTFQ